MNDSMARTIVALQEGSHRLEQQLRAISEERDLLLNQHIIAEARAEQLETALRPFVEKWDLHAAQYLMDRVDGEEVRVLPARVIAEMIEDIKAARAALDGGTATPEGGNG